MKSHIRNKSELVELRYCYLLLLYNFTIFLSVGNTREFWFQILLLPMVRIISLFSKLFESSKLLAKIAQSVLLISIILCCWLFSLRSTFNVSVNTFFFKVFCGEILITIILHRVIFFSKKTIISNSVLPIYRFFKRYYIDLVLVLLAYIFVYHFLRLDYGWGLVLSINHFWHTLRFYVYLYLFYIIVAGIWYVVGTIYKKKK